MTIQIGLAPGLEVVGLGLGRRRRVVLLRDVAVCVHDRLDRDGDDRGRKRPVARTLALQAILEGGLVECDENNDCRRVYCLVHRRA